MQPHILQLHDWHAAAAALLFWECYHGAGLWRPRMVLTIHNMENTGECKQDEFAASGMSGEVFATADKALDERTIGHNPERINLMKVCMGKGGQEREMMMQRGDPISPRCCHTPGDPRESSGGTLYHHGVVTLRGGRAVLFPGIMSMTSDTFFDWIHFPPF